MGCLTGYRTGLPMGCLRLVIHWGYRKAIQMETQKETQKEIRWGYPMAMQTECLRWETPTENRTGYRKVIRTDSRLAFPQRGYHSATLTGYPMDCRMGCRSVIRWGCRTDYRSATHSVIQKERHLAFLRWENHLGYLTVIRWVIH